MTFIQKKLNQSLMKKNIVISILCLFLISCNNLEQVNIIVKNNSNSDILISNYNDSILVNSLIKKRSLDNLIINSEINIFTKKTSLNKDFSSTELSSYLSDNKEYYIFYFAKIIQKENIIKFQNQLDSIVINVDDLKIGKDKMNNMIFENDKLILNKK